MPTNSNFGRQINNMAKATVGGDSPAQQACPNCRQLVYPLQTNGPSLRTDRKSAATATMAGYSCPACGNNLTLVKSTGKAGGPVQSNKTNLNTAPDF